MKPVYGQPTAGLFNTTLPADFEQVDTPLVQIYNPTCVHRLAKERLNSKGYILRLLIPRAREIRLKAFTPRLLGWLLGLLLVAALYYLPGFVAQEDNPQLNNLFNHFSRIYTASTSDLSGDWQKGRGLIRNFGLPLWYPDESRALLADSSAPLFYPLSLIYYAPVSKGMTLFALVHFWLFGLGLVLLAGRLKRGRYLCLLVLLLPLGVLSLNVLAGLSWLPLGMWLLTSKRWTARWFFAGICGLLLLAVDWPLALVFIGLLIGWSVGCEIVLRQAKAGQLIKLVGILGMMVLLGAGIAGPQLFPRLSYAYGPDRVAAFTPPPSGKFSEIRPSQAIQIGNIVRANPTQIEVSLIVPPGSVPFELVLTERYAAGWTATTTTSEKEAGKGRESKVSATSEGWLSSRLEPLAEGGEYRIQFRYNPMAFTLGVYAAFLALAGVGMGFVVLAWGRFYQEDENSHPIRRIAKNSVTPLFAQLFGKALDFGFALFSLRLLGPEGNGRYTIAGTTWLILATLTDFGLETLVTREVARDRSFENANRLYWTMLLARFGLAILSFPIALLWVGGFSLTGNMAEDTTWAILILMIGFLPGCISSSMTALFRGYEKYEFLAAIQVLTAIIRVPLGLGALLIGWGVVGLAGSSVVVNFITAIALASLFRREIFQPRFKGAFDFKLVRTLLMLSYPLVLNSLLNNILFKSDALLLGAIRSDSEVGLYNSAYKFIDAVLIIPSAFTLALFPVLASYATTAKPALKRAFIEGVRILLLIGLPISAGVVFVAYDLIGALGGSRFLPGGAICLQVLIWFLPFSYINGLTQYVLIALNKQRLITLAFVVTAVTNIGLNLIFIPLFGYLASSAITIVSELIMLAFFGWPVWSELGSLPFWKVSWRPLLASGLMMLGLLGLTVGLGFNHFFLTVPVGGLIYIGVLLLTRTITPADMQIVKKIISRR